MIVLEELNIFSPMWQEFLKITEGEEWKYTEAERERIQTLRLLVNQPSYFLSALDKDE